MEQLRVATERELESQGSLQDRLLELQLAYELGEIGEEDYTHRWSEINARLDALDADEGNRSDDAKGVGDWRAP